MNYDNWDLNASDIDLKIELYNKMIKQLEKEIAALNSKIEKLILLKMEKNQEALYE